ncbi:hypothetical protein PCYB_002180, partial [Plasmodium cynomolgi strain B]
MSLLKDGYQLSAHVKNKINSMNFFRETWGKKIRLYKEANKIDLLKKNEFDKIIISEAFNVQDENILHLVLNPPMTSVLDEQDGRAVSGMSGGVANRGDRTPNIRNDTAFTTNLEDEKIIQECTHQLLINEKAKVKNGESEEEAIIWITEIGLNYFGNLFEYGKTSGEGVYSHNDITEINIWECFLMISKWIYDLWLQNITLFSNKVVLELGAGSGLARISLFTHAYIFLNGTNQAPNQVVITDVNPFTLSNISHNVLLNEEIFGHLDSAWR